jgi:flagellar biosynthetic protein FliR
MLVGIAMGFAARIVFAAVELAGEFIGFPDGPELRDLLRSDEFVAEPVVTEFMTLISILLFLSLNGHLMYVATLAQSFQAIGRSAAARRRQLG